MPRAAAVLRLHVVDYAVVVIDERGVEARIVEPIAARPSVQRIVRQPQMITRKTSRHLDVSPANHALMTRRVIRESANDRVGRKNIRNAGAVRGLNVERSSRPAALSRNRGGKQTIACDRVAARPVVHHGHTRESAARFNTITDDELSDGVWICGARGDNDRLISCGKRWIVRHLVNSRTCVRDRAAVARAGSAEIYGHGQTSERFKP